MPYESFSVSELIPADPERIYAAWMDSAEHTAFTGDTASIEPYVGGRHSVFDGYAVGSTVELLPGRRIVQTWRAEDFPPGSPDSRVEVTLEATVGGTMVTIFHTEIPTGRSDGYRDAWLKHYLEPLKGYFARTVIEDAPTVSNGVHGSNGVPTRAPKVRAAAKAPPKKRPAPKAVKARPKAKARPKTKARAKTKTRPKATKKPAPKKKTAGRAKRTPRRAR